MSDPTRFIGVDWGTSNLRIMRVSDQGTVQKVRSDPRGAGQLSADQFLPVLRQVAGDWLTPAIPILVCGMAGARGRWLETGYRPCPASLQDLKPVALKIPDLDIAILPGVCTARDGVLTDVMRGEETQVLGLPDASLTGLVVTPGTHSKWITLEAGVIQTFRTFMTGELFAAIQSGTLLGQGITPSSPDPAAFEEGVIRALSDPALTALLFSARIGRLSDQLPEASVSDYLSGLLIGAEIAAQGSCAGRSVSVIGSPELTTRYATALKLAGWNAPHKHDSLKAGAMGLWRILEVHRP